MIIICLAMHSKRIKGYSYIVESNFIHFVSPENYCEYAATSIILKKVDLFS